MAIKRYYATKDNTITNAFKADLSTRGTGSNMGASDILEAFVIHGQTSASINATNAEQSRIILEFPVSTLLSDITNGVVPSSSVEYRLNLFNAPHANTTPLSYSLDVLMLSQSWSEGRGLDMDNYTDIGVSNWISGTQGTAWGDEGGSYLRGAGCSASFFFSGGMENINLDVSDMVGKWTSEAVSNYGFLLKNTDAAISGTEGSFYTKMFFGRTSEFFLKRPYLEARWDSTRRDNRSNTYLSSALADSADNLNTLYLYNVVRGELKNIPGLVENQLRVNFYSSSADTPSGSALTVISSQGSTVTNITGGLLYENDTAVSGVYTASFAITSAFDFVNDVWFSGSNQYFTSSFEPRPLAATKVIYDKKYITSISNLMAAYQQGDNATLRVFVREKNWNPNIYTVASTEVEPEIIENAYYRISRVVDNFPVVPYDTGSTNSTRLSYDVSGNYFDLDTSYLEPGYAYELRFTYYLNGTYQEQPQIFKFRINEQTL